MRITKPIERWFPIPNDPDKGELCIKQLLPGERAEIFDVAIKQTARYEKKDSGSYEPFFIQETDKKKDRELTLIKTVVGWKNMFDAEGKPLEFNRDNLLRASNEIVGFNECVTEFRNQLNEDIEKEKKEQEKNLSSSARKFAK